MKQFPATPNAAGAPDELFASGHLWLLEHVAGAPLRFQVRDSGLLRFGDRDRVYDDPEELPESYRQAVRHVREHLDRDALRRAVDDVADVAFFGVATARRGIDYDWEHTPPFLGYDVWSAEREAFRPPDAAAAIFERLGLTPANAVERELPARDFDPDSYAIPESAWYDGPAAGVLVRNKRGGRALLRDDVSADDVGEDDEAAITTEAAIDTEATADGSNASDAPAEALAAQFATPTRFERIASDLDDRGQPVTAETLAERVLEAVARETRPRRYGEDGTIDRAAVRAAVATAARQFLDDRPDDAW